MTLNYNCFLLFLAALLFVTPASHAAPPVKTGAQLSAEAGFSELFGKRVGLVTNHTALVEGTHLIDLLHGSASVTLAALFAPEHGLRGLQEDGATIVDGKDDKTGVKVFSLYGRKLKPTREMLRDIDVLAYDIQDIGARFYTFISTMGLAMQAAADARIPFIVFDRPNPLGGEYVDGPLAEKGFNSFVGLYPIPVAHGMTVGELALMIKGERMLPGLEELDLRVVKMGGWQRAMQWPDTGLAWIRTSPNIPDFETALLYPGLCFLEATTVSEGRGTMNPFKQAGAPGFETASLLSRIDNALLPGLGVESASFIPQAIPGMSSKPKYRGKQVAGVRLAVSDRRALKSVQAGVVLLSAFYRGSRGAEQENFFRKKGFDLLAGTDRLRLALRRGMAPESIIADWQEGLKRFTAKRQKYLLY